MKMQAAIFDMDGTLIDSLMFWDRYWSDFGKTFLNDDNFLPPEDLCKRIRTMIFTDGVREIRRSLPVSITEDQILDYSAEYLNHFYRTEVKAKEGVIDFLTHLRTMGISCALATATDRKFIQVAIDACGLNGFFDHILSCTDIGVGKERPDIFLLAAERLGAPVERSCVFEDSCVALQCAKSAGFLTVGIYDKHNYGHDLLRAASDLYVDNGETMMSLIPHISNS